MNFGRILVSNGWLVGKNVTSIVTQDSSARFCSTMSSRNFDVTKEKIEFCNSFPSIIDDLAEHPKFKELPVAKEWMKKVINGTATGGKLSRGLAAVMSYKITEDLEYVTEEKIHMSHALGWCIELFQAYCVVLDDIVDGSSTRRGKPCWYKREDVGMAHAVNDACLVYFCLHQILKMYFEKSPIYVKLFQTFNEAFLYTSIGQFLDIRGSEHNKNYDLFTREDYENIIKHKSSYYTYKLPISVGLLLANNLSEESHKNCENISFLIGKLFQIQDDYIDCFGDESLTGKMGTDIQEGKCSWLAVTALQRCNNKNRAVFAACYGSKEPAHIERIKQLYVQLDLPNIYKEQEREMYNDVIQEISTVSADTQRQLYKMLLDMTYDRKK